MSTERPQRCRQLSPITTERLPNINSPTFHTKPKKETIKPRQGHCVTNGSIMLIDPPVSPPPFPVGPAAQCWDLCLQEKDQYQPLCFDVHIFHFQMINVEINSDFFLFPLQSSKCQEDGAGQVLTLIREISIEISANKKTGDISECTEQQGLFYTALLPLV